MAIEDLNLEHLDPKTFPAHEKFQETYGSASLGSEFEEIRAAREDQLRHLRSYCVVQEEAMLSHFNPPSASDVYGELATKLAAILDGES